MAPSGMRATRSGSDSVMGAAPACPAARRRTGSSAPTVQVPRRPNCRTRRAPRCGLGEYAVSSPLGQTGVTAAGLRLRHRGAAFGIKMLGFVVPRLRLGSARLGSARLGDAARRRIPCARHADRRAHHRGRLQRPRHLRRADLVAIRAARGDPDRPRRPLQPRPFDRRELTTTSNAWIDREIPQCQALHPEMRDAEPDRADGAAAAVRLPHRRARPRRRAARRPRAQRRGPHDRPAIRHPADRDGAGLGDRRRLVRSDATDRAAKHDGRAWARSGPRIGTSRTR